MVGAERRPDVEQRILGDPELGDLGFGLDLGLAERGALRFGDILRLRLAGAELEAGITVAIRLAAADDLDVVHLQDGHGHVPAVRLEQAGHSHFLRDHAGAHDQNSSHRGTRTISGACSPSIIACPAWASASQGSGGDAARSQPPAVSPNFSHRLVRAGVTPA